MSIVTGITLNLACAPIKEIIIPGANNWFGFVCSSDASRIVACGYANYIAISSDTGNTWSYKATDTGRDGIWLTLAAKRDLTVLLAGNDYNLWLSTDSGENWNMLTTPSNGNWKVTGVSDTPGVLFAGRDLGPIYKSTDSGITWVVSISDTTKTWGRMVVANNIVAVSVYSQGNLYVSSDLGTTWNNPTSLPITSDWQTLAISQNGRKLITGYYGGSLYTSTDSGTTWVELTDRYTNSWRQAGMSYDGNTICVPINYGGNPIYTTDFCVTWTTKGPAGFQGWQNIVMNSIGDKYILTNGGPLYIVTTNIPPDLGDIFSPYAGGRIVNTGIYPLTSGSSSTWIQQTSSGIHMWQSITSSSDGVKLAVCAINDYIHTSSNSGTTWIQRTNSGIQSWTSITSSSDGTILIACVGDGYVWRSTDIGISWTQQAAVQNWRSITSSSDGTKIFGCEFGQYIWRSTNSGVTWRARASIYDWTSIACSENGVTVAATIGNGYIWVSNDTGNTWNVKSSSGIRNWSCITSSSDSSLLAACVNGGYIYISTDFGNTWIENISVGSRNWYSISASSNGLISACANNDYIYISKDNGVSWQRQTSVGSNNWYSIVTSSNGVNIALCARNDYIYTLLIPKPVDVGQILDLTANSKIPSETTTGLYINYYNIGVVWNVVTNIPANASYNDTILSYDGTSILFAEGNGSGRIFKSSNSGISWVQLTTSGTRNTNTWDLSWSNDCSIILASQTPPILSTNSGVTWTTLSNVGTSGASSRGGCVSADGTYMGYCDYKGGGAGYVFISSDTGQTWTQRAGPKNWHYIKTSSDGRIWAACVQYQYIWTSTDYGVTWIERTTSRRINWHGLAMNADGTRIYANYWGSNIIQVSTNFGVTWRDISNVPGYTRWAIGTSFDGTAILTGDYSDGYLYVSLNSGNTWFTVTSQGLRRWYGMGVSGNGQKFVASSQNPGAVLTSFAPGYAPIDISIAKTYF